MFCMIEQHVPQRIFHLAWTRNWTDVIAAHKDGPKESKDLPQGPSDRRDQAPHASLQRRLAFGFKNQMDVISLDCEVLDLEAALLRSPNGTQECPQKFRCPETRAARFQFQCHVPGRAPIDFGSRGMREFMLQTFLASCSFTATAMRFEYELYLFSQLHLGICTGARANNQPMPRRVA